MLAKSPWKWAHSLLITGAAFAVLGADDPKKPPSSPAGSESAEVIQALQEAWPDHPEWVDMLTSILQDETMSSNYGWFRTAVAQMRFDWESSKEALRPQR